ncbi:helix-turn-helix transcriptional regulator [Paenibacillus sacheonensis]|uniref:Helix-turn-helix domain-containing protein n=1 Tax=Paenibacillus sacheonensis TaxID=742054 RepID=A0A7X4YQK2_9BACL|nr:AraC family transcriptional regulator [Paenibacillus sacheonensis]MBM7567817.1 AraC-like DNA-binding protein [Paenibacillus sacheonensis]NBC70707.1 helix-turn-helix domain-containing protein [Paenibacillus sacheonensis]
MRGVDLIGIRIPHMEVGSSAGFPDGWVHEKTVPFGIVAQATAGSYKLQTESGTYVVTGSEAFLTPAHLPLRITHIADPDTGLMSARFVHFQFVVMDTFDLFHLYELPLTCDAETGRRFGELIEAMLALRETGPDGASSIAVIAKNNELAYRLLSLLLELATPTERSASLLNAAQELQPVLAHIRDHWADAIDIDVLLRKFAGSRSLLFQLFRKQFQQSPMDYVKSTRLNEAYRKLCTTDMPVAEIALMSGFANSFHFSREFKAKFGRTPTEARRANRLWMST